MCIREKTEGACFFPIQKLKTQYFPICKLISCCCSTEGMGKFIMVNIHLEMHKHEVLHKPRKQRLAPWPACSETLRGKLGHLGQLQPMLRACKMVNSSFTSQPSNFETSYKKESQQPNNFNLFKSNFASAELSHSLHNAQSHT